MTSNGMAQSELFVTRNMQFIRNLRVAIIIIIIIIVIITPASAAVTQLDTVIHVYKAAIRCPQPQSGEAPSGQRLRGKGRQGVICR